MINLQFILLILYTNSFGLFFPTMKIYNSIDSFTKLSKAVVTTGTFDGVHLGHKKILNTLQYVGEKSKSDTVIITFSSHPRMILYPDHDFKLINTREENTKLFQMCGVDHVVFQTFDKQFSRLSSLQYIRDILLKKIGLTDLVIGYNHHFGRNREGSFANLDEYSEVYGFNIHQVKPYFFNKKSVSSTKIRDAINNGLIQLASQYLGYNFQLTGRVIKGKGVGNQIGFPTANIELENINKIIPKNGVYVVYVLYKNQRFKGMLNIGLNPTFNTQKLSIEVHIFDFYEIIYDEYITLEFIKKIRNEQKFASIEDLRQQLTLDKITVLNTLD